MRRFHRNDGRYHIRRLSVISMLKVYVSLVMLYPPIFPNEITVPGKACGMDETLASWHLIKKGSTQDGALSPLLWLLNSSKKSRNEKYSRLTAHLTSPLLCFGFSHNRLVRTSHTKYSFPISR